MIITLDVETTGLQFKVDTVTSLSLCFSDNVGSKKIILVTEDILNYFHRILITYPNAIYVGHNIKFDLRMLEVHPDLIDTLDIVDTTILYHFVHPRGSKKLGDIEKDLFQTDTKKTFLDRYGKDFSKWPKEDLEEYNKNDVSLTFHIYKLLIKQIDQRFLSYQQAYLKTLYRMEFQGFSFDSDQAYEEINNLATIGTMREEGLRNYIFSEYGYGKAFTINFNSSKQLSELLYTDLDIPKPERDSYPQGAAFDKLFTSTLTNADLLKKINHPFVKMFMEYKEVSSVSKAIESYNDLSVGGRLYPSFNITGTVTGRLSCSKPNLQNIAKEKKNADLTSVRSLFRPNDGESLVSIDYQQQEIRMLAVLSQDKNLLDLVNQGVDMHTVVGLKMFRKESLTKQERDTIKNIHFGMLYGLGISAIAYHIGSDFDYADYLVSTYYEQFPDVRLWMDETKDKARLDQQLTLFTGRVWECLPGMEYQGVNAMIQGSCAELTGIAAIRCNNILKRTGAGSILSIIHDELLFSLADKSVIPSLISSMELQQLFNVKFLVDSEDNYK